MKKLLVTALLLCSTVTWAQPYTATFSVSDDDGSLPSFTKSLGARTFTFSGASFLCYYPDDGLLYGLDESSTNVEITIEIENGYLFDVNSLMARADGSTMQFTGTRGDNSTIQFTRNDITNGSMGPVSGTGFPITGIKKLVIFSADYGGIQDLVVTNLMSALPVELTTFIGKASVAGVTLAWKTATEVGNYGFDVERRPTSGKTWTKVGFVEGHGTTNKPQSYAYVDAASSSAVAYRLKQVDTDGKFEYSKEIEVAPASIPTSAALGQNYPNPFNPATTISFTLPIRSAVTLKMYDVAGQELETLVSGTLDAGSYERQWNAARYPSGVYFYRLQAGGCTETKRLLLLK